MLCIIPEGSCSCMSAVIGICGDNYAAILGDRRKIIITKDDVMPVNDDTQKVFAINNRVLFGVTGLFAAGEDFLAPFAGYKDKGNITLRLAFKAVKSYLERRTYYPVRRHYILCGRDNKGSYHAYGIYCDPGDPTVHVIEYSPGASEHGIILALPASLHQEVDVYTEKINACIQSSKTREEMLQKVCEVMHQIADRDKSVGKEIDVMLIP